MVSCDDLLDHLNIDATNLLAVMTQVHTATLALLCWWLKSKLWMDACVRELSC
jgi:hypothetical protein